MSNRSLHRVSEWTQESPIHVSPHAFDALSDILGRTIARGIQQRTAELPGNSRETKREERSETPTSVRMLPYKWAARHLLAKMRVEVN